MNVLALRTENYRNLAPCSLEFDPGINVIYGKNAQGKTNLLESLYLFTGGHSFRGARDSELVAFGQTGCRLSLDFYTEGRDQTIDLTIQNGRRSFAVNGVEKRTGADLIGKFCGVIFSPEHLTLVKGGPAMRRSFLDGALCQSRPSYARDFVQYQRTLQQRNGLLKEIQKNPAMRETLEIWNQFLAQRGLAVIRQRQELMTLLEETAAECYRGISQNKETLSLKYSATAAKDGALSEELFLERLQATEKSDLITGYTSIGPHRDDLEILIDGNSARMYGSQGQQRSAVLVAKTAEAAALEKRTGEKPVILLDDVMSELDGDRQDYLLNQIKGRQIFLTCCDPNTIACLKEGALFYVESGAVTSSIRKADES